MLSGIRIIDFSQNLPGPYTTLRLADFGAEVIKVEPPAGDATRFSYTEEQDDGSLFKAQNRNKQSIVLNLKEAEQQRIAMQLIQDADVVVESFRPGVTTRLGIGYEAASQVNPRIIYCSLTGYGQHGIMHHLGSHDLNYVALSGLLSQFKDKAGIPVHPTTTMADLVGGIVACESILAALYHREKTGKGSHIDLALADVMISLMINHVMIESATGYPNGIWALNQRVISYALYETKDGRYVSLAALEPKFWRNFCTALQKPEWVDAHLSSPVVENQVYLQLITLFRSRTMEEWSLFSRDVDCCMTPVLDTGELYQHPYIKERKLIEEIEGVRYVLTRHTPRVSPPPKLGEHTDAVMGIGKMEQKNEGV